MDDPIDPPDMPLDERQRRFVQFVAKGIPLKDAARQAGYSEAYSRKTRHLMKHPGIARELSIIQKEARIALSYDVQTAMLECAAVIAFAKSKGNAMAYCKTVELRAKLSGLLIDRVEVFSADLKGALEAARNRVVMVNAPPPQPCVNPGPATDPPRGTGRGE
jgi:hypothetical protein